MSEKTDVTYLFDENGTLTHAVLPIALWHRMEAIADDASMDLAMEDGGEAFPGDVVNRLADGVSPIKVFREYRGITQAELGEQVGVDRKHISNVEAGRRAGGIELRRRIAKTLSVDLDDLEPWPQDQPAVSAAG